MLKKLFGRTTPTEGKIPEEVGVEKIYEYIGEALSGLLPKKRWKTATLNIEASKRYCGYDGEFVDSKGKINDIFKEGDLPLETDDKIWELLELTQKNNFTPWNRAVYTLDSKGHFDMEFRWDQELQDEWDKGGSVV